MFRDVNGFLIVHTAYLEPKNYFQLSCRKCENKDFILTFEDRPQCRKCSATEEELIIRWNVRCHIIDDQ